jgi:hypothetical protein
MVFTDGIVSVPERHLLIADWDQPVCLAIACCCAFDSAQSHLRNVRVKVLVGSLPAAKEGLPGGRAVFDFFELLFLERISLYWTTGDRKMVFLGSHLVGLFPGLSIEVALWFPILVPLEKNKAQTSRSARPVWAKVHGMGTENLCSLYLTSSLFFHPINRS